MMTSPYIEKKKREFPQHAFLYWYDPKRMDAVRAVLDAFPGDVFTWPLEVGRGFAFRRYEDLARFERVFVAAWRRMV